jgi:hypothetical protein
MAQHFSLAAVCIGAPHLTHLDANLDGYRDELSQEHAETSIADDGEDRAVGISERVWQTQAMVARFPG